MVIAFLVARLSVSLVDRIETVQLDAKIRFSPFYVLGFCGKNSWCLVQRFCFHLNEGVKMAYMPLSLSPQRPTLQRSILTASSASMATPCVDGIEPVAKVAV